MKLVIDIPKIMYGAIKEYGITFLSRDDKKTLRKLIANGTPLPGHHGRLIDADSMKTMKNIQSANFNAVELIRLWIDNQPTIIEGSDNNAKESTK